MYVFSQFTSAEMVMTDGSPSLEVSSSPVILEDSSFLTHLTITLTNPQDSTSFESISLSSSYSLPDEITLQVSDGLTIELTGTASTDIYTSALSAVYYTYTKMDGIIENQPDFTPRYNYVICNALLVLFYTIIFFSQSDHSGSNG